MPFAIGSTGRIRTNIPAQNAYNSLNQASRGITQSQLRVSTGYRINSAADDVAGYITSRALSSRNSTLSSALSLTKEAETVTNIAMDGYDNVGNLLRDIKNATLQATSGALGTDEKVALAKYASQMADQVTTVVESTVYGGQKLIDGNYNKPQLSGLGRENAILTSDIDLTSDEEGFTLNRVENGAPVEGFAGVEGFDISVFKDVSADDLGIFSDENINQTIKNLNSAIRNVNNVNSKVGGINNKLQSQSETLISQTTNYSAALSRIQDADMAQEALNLSRNSFLENSAATSLAQANMNANRYLDLLRNTF